MDAIRINGDSMITEKSNLCYHRVDEGLIPVCADNVCPAHGIYFGGPNEIAQKQMLLRA